MLLSRVFVKRISRSTAAPSLTRSPFPLALSTKSHAINLFGDPRPLNLYATIFYKNSGGRGCSPSPKSFHCHRSENSAVSPAIATDPKTPRNNPCRCHTSETPRGVVTPYIPYFNLSTVQCELTYPLYFHILANSFALIKTTIPLFSTDSALFAKNHPGWGTLSLLASPTSAILEGQK